LHACNSFLNKRVQIGHLKTNFLKSSLHRFLKESCRRTR
jgi:hypothetical protein